MTKYESEIKTISSKDEVVFAILSDLKKLEKLKEREELSEKLQEAQFEHDSCQFPIDGFGTVGIKVAEREPNTKIKLVSEHFPFDLALFFHLRGISENETELKITLEAELPTMIKLMVDSKIKEGINKIADVLATTLSE